MGKNKNKKICLCASSGGHFEQLMTLKPLLTKFDGFVLTEKTEYTALKGTDKVYYTPQVNRKEFLFIFKFLWIFVKSFFIFIKEKPDCIICTGVLAMIPMCLIGKLFGKKLIYIESFAKVSSPTETGKLLYKYADRFYVQWESMKEFYPDAICIGGIY